MFVDVCVYVCACVLTLFLPIVTPLTLLFLFLPDKGHGIAMCKYGVSDLVKYKFSAFANIGGALWTGFGALLTLAPCQTKPCPRNYR